MLGQELDRTDAVLLDALFDLARLLVCVDVKRELVVGGVAPDLREPLRRTRPDGVGGEADLEAAFTEVLDLIQVLGRRGLAHALEPASGVRDVQEDEGDPGCARSFRGGERLLEAEIVELADRRIARGAHLAVDLLVAGADALRRLLAGELEHRIAPGPEISALGAASKGALEGVAVCVDEAGDREPVRHVPTLSASPSPVPAGTNPLVPVTSSRLRGNRSTGNYP